jgi:hypothetical protein
VGDAWGGRGGARGGRGGAEAGGAGWAWERGSGHGGMRSDGPVCFALVGPVHHPRLVHHLDQSTGQRTKPGVRTPMGPNPARAHVR